MENNKDFKIYKFEYAKRNFSTTKLHSLAQDLTKFKVALIDRFSSENFDSLIKYTHWAKAFNIPMVKYKKDWLYDQYEIGYDMIAEKYKVHFEYQWSSWYIAVPLKEAEMIRWFDENVPSWATTVKRL